MLKMLSWADTMNSSVKYRQIIQMHIRRYEPEQHSMLLVRDKYLEEFLNFILENFSSSFEGGTRRHGAKDFDECRDGEATELPC